MLTRVAAVVFGAALGVLVAEGAVRLVAPQPITPLTAGFAPAGAVVFDDRYGWKLVPHGRWPWQNGTTVETNSLGLRDHEYGPKSSREVRVLSLGDSFAFGAGVELDQTYAKVLERKLQARFPDLTIAVINAGIAGYGQRQEILALHDLRTALDPDVVIATFVAGNDVENNTVLDEQLQHRTKSPLGFLGRHSHGLRLLLKSAYPFTDALMNRDDENIDRTITLLRQLEGDLRAADLPYRMLVIPARHQIRPHGQGWTSALIRAGFESFLFRQNRMVIDHFEREHVPYVDALAPLIARDAVESVVFDDDSHTNAVGHEVIAEALAASLAEPVTAIRRHRQQTAWHSP